MDLKWLHDGTTVLVVSNGRGEPLTEKGDANGDYVPSVVARLTTEQVEPAQLSDTDPLAEDAPLDTTYPGQLAGYPPPPPQSPAVVGPAKVTTSTATEDPTPVDVRGLQAENARLQAELDAARRDLAGGPAEGSTSTTTGPGPEAST